MSYLSRLLIPGEEVRLVARRSVAATFGLLLLLEVALLAAAAGLYLWGGPETGAGVGVSRGDSKTSAGSGTLSGTSIVDAQAAPGPCSSPIEPLSHVGRKGQALFHVEHEGAG